MPLKVTITHKRNDLKKFLEGLALIGTMEVYVGVPQEKTKRRGDKINNASLLFIQTHGSPIRHIPPRPVIEPAISAKGNRERIALELKAAASASLIDGNRVAARAGLRRAGMVGMNAARAWFTDARNHWAPNAPSTILAKGSSQPLIDTGQMRKSITYVVK